MITFRPDKFNLIITEKFVSTSGKYTIFLGEHFDGTEECYDVGSFNNQNGEVTRRHYKVKSECQEWWEEFKYQMRGTGEYEDGEPGGFTIISPN